MTAFALICLALILAALGATVIRNVEDKGGFALGVLFVGLALCLCIEAGRHWT